MTKWPCSECAKEFSRKGDLTRHELLHAGYKPHLCLECGKSFAQRSALNTHMNTHTRVKPFRCNLCPASFGDPSSRARHSKELHSKHPPGAYQCPESRCKSSIKRRSAFTAHLRKHGAKYLDVDISAFYSAVAHPRTNTRRAAPKTEPIGDSAVAGITTYGPQPVYDSFIHDGVLGYPNDYFNDMGLLATGDLISFSPRSSPLSLPALTPSSSCSSISSSPSPPAAFMDDQPEFSLPYAHLNAFNDSGMSGAYPDSVLSPVSQLIFTLGCDLPEYNKQPASWA